MLVGIRFKRNEPVVVYLDDLDSKPPKKCSLEHFIIILCACVCVSMCVCLYADA